MIQQIHIHLGPVAPTSVKINQRLTPDFNQRLNKNVLHHRQLTDNTRLNPG